MCPSADLARAGYDTPSTYADSVGYETVPAASDIASKLADLEIKPIDLGKVVKSSPTSHLSNLQLLSTKQIETILTPQKKVPESQASQTQESVKRASELHDVSQTSVVSKARSTSHDTVALSSRSLQEPRKAIAESVRASKDSSSARHSPSISDKDHFKLSIASSQASDSSHGYENHWKLILDSSHASANSLHASEASAVEQVPLGSELHDEALPQDREAIDRDSDFTLSAQSSDGYQENWRLRIDTANLKPRYIADDVSVANLPARTFYPEQPAILNQSYMHYELQPPPPAQFHGYTEAIDFPSREREVGQLLAVPSSIAHSEPLRESEVFHSISTESEYASAKKSSSFPIFQSFSKSLKDYMNTAVEKSVEVLSNVTSTFSTSHAPASDKTSQQSMALKLDLASQSDASFKTATYELKRSSTLDAVTPMSSIKKSFITTSSCKSSKSSKAGDKKIEPVRSDEERSRLSTHSSAATKATKGSRISEMASVSTLVYPQKSTDPKTSVFTRLSSHSSPVLPKSSSIKSGSLKKSKRKHKSGTKTLAVKTDPETEQLSQISTATGIKTSQTNKSKESLAKATSISSMSKTSKSSKKTSTATSIDSRVSESQSSAKTHSSRSKSSTSVGKISTVSASSSKSKSASVNYSRSATTIDQERSEVSSSSSKKSSVLSNAVSSSTTEQSTTSRRTSRSSSVKESSTSSRRSSGKTKSSSYAESENSSSPESSSATKTGTSSGTRSGTSAPTRTSETTQTRTSSTGTTSEKSEASDESEEESSSDDTTKSSTKQSSSHTVSPSISARSRLKTRKKSLPTLFRIPEASAKWRLGGFHDSSFKREVNAYDLSMDDSSGAIDSLSLSRLKMLNIYLSDFAKNTNMKQKVNLSDPSISSLGSSVSLSEDDSLYNETVPVPSARCAKATKQHARLGHGCHKYDTAFHVVTFKVHPLKPLKRKQVLPVASNQKSPKSNYPGIAFRFLICLFSCFFILLVTAYFCLNGAYATDGASYDLLYMCFTDLFILLFLVMPITGWIVYFAYASLVRRKRVLIY